MIYLAEFFIAAFWGYFSQWKFVSIIYYLKIVYSSSQLAIFPKRPHPRIENMAFWN